MRSLLILSLFSLNSFSQAAPRSVDGRTCRVSKGYQTLDVLNQNQDDPNHSKLCNSKRAACFAFTGFGDGQEYPFEEDHGSHTNGTIAEGHADNQCESFEFACSSSNNEYDSDSGRQCIPSNYLCDGDDDCQDGSDEQFDFCASRYTDEEYGRYNCLEGEIYQQGRVLGEFFKRLLGGRRGLRNGFLNLIVSNAKANVDISLSGARLVASALTDFRSVMDKKSRGEPQDAKVDLIVKIEDVTVKARMTGDFTNLFKAFDKIMSTPFYRLVRNQEDMFEMLDMFDETFDIMEQSISGDVKSAYKKIKPFVKWMYVNMENQFGPGNRDRDYEWSTYGGDKIKVDLKLKASVGDDNSADIKLDGEASEAAKAFANNGYLAALNGNMEICDEKSKECNRMMICGTDLCNTFEPTQWKASTLANDCPAGKWKNGLGGCQECQCSKSGSIANECNKETGQCYCKPGLIGQNCDRCPPQSIRYLIAEHESANEALGDDLVQDQEDCLFCVQQPDQSEKPEWINQFDYEEGCFSCLSIQECKTFDQKGCPAACLNY